MLDYEDDMIITMLDHTLGRQMIDVGQATDAGDRVYKIIQRLISTPHNKGQPMSANAEMLEFYEIFRVMSKEPLQKLHDASRDPRQDHQARTWHRRGQAKGHVTKDVGWTNTGEHRILSEAVQARQGEDVPDPDRKDGNKDDTCAEIHGNQVWIRTYERMIETTMWSGDASDKGISDNK